MTITQPLSTLIFTVTAGVLALIVGAKLKVPSILFFLVFGILLGPEFADLIQPRIFRHNFPHYISLMVALILFEGGSTLKFSQYREISRTLRNLLSVGVLVTLVGVSLAAHYFADLTWRKSIIFGAVMIVTGPTVVIPILRRLRVQEKVHNILKWESILIDPLGVIVAIVMFEFLVLQSGGFWASLILLAGRIAIGAAFGLATGFFMVYCLTQRWLLRSEGEELGGLFILFMTVFSYGVSEFMLSESGLVTVTVAGIYFGNKKFPFHKEIDHFKDQVVNFALSILFVLLASNIPVRAATKIPIEGMLLIVTMVFLIRPLGVFLSTASDKNLSFREKCFLSLMAPRGIVSASLASLFAIEFEERALTGRGYFLPLAFFAIAGMIVFYAVLADLIARFTGVKEGELKGVMIVGANPFGLLVGAELRKEKVPIKFIDSNPRNCAQAREMGFEIYEGNAIDAELLEFLDIKGVGRTIALTPNHEANLLSCQAFSKFIPRKNIFRLWDKSDQWDVVTAAHFDASMGNPMVVSAGQPGLDIWELVEIGSYKICRKRLNQDMKATFEVLKIEAIDFPLFALKNAEPVFLSPNQVIPKESEIIYLDVDPSR